MRITADTVSVYVDRWEMRRHFYSNWIKLEDKAYNLIGRSHVEEMHKRVKASILLEYDAFHLSVPLTEAHLIKLDEQITELLEFSNQRFRVRA